MDEREFNLTGEPAKVAAAFFELCNHRNLEPHALREGQRTIVVSAWGKTAAERTLPNIARRFALQLTEVL